MLNVFRLVHTRISIDNYPLFHHKNANAWVDEYKIDRSGFGFNRKWGIAETDS